MSLAITAEEKKELLYYMQLSKIVHKKKKLIKGLSKVEYFDIDNVEGLTAVTKDSFVVVFEPSSSFFEYINDNDWLLTNFLYEKVPFFHGIPVHLGFISSWDKIKEVILKRFTELGKNKIIVAGHSLGGALAQLASLDLKYRTNKTINCFSYGSPRVGGYKFKKEFNKKVNKHIRVVYSADPVPHVPFVLTPSLFSSKFIFPRLMLYLHTKGKLKLKSLNKRKFFEFIKDFWLDHLPKRYLNALESV